MIRVYIKNKKCGTEEFFKLIGTNSKVAVIRSCYNEKQALLSELREALKGEVDENTLAKRLVEFTKAGVIDRISYNENNSTVTVYRVTQKSIDVIPILNAMESFYEEHGIHRKAAEGEELGSYVWIYYLRQILGSKWNSRIIWLLFVLRKMRFNELKDSIEGISFKMLSQQLKLLEAEGIVRREEIDDIMPHTEYSLTNTGSELYTILLAIAEWDSKHIRSKMSDDERADRINFDMPI